MRSAPLLLCLSLSIVGCAGPARPSASKGASPGKERPFGFYLDTFDEPYFQERLDSRGWLDDPSFADAWKARGICSEFEQRDDPRFFHCGRANNTAYLGGMVGDFESMLYVVEVWVNEEGTSEESMKCVLTPRVSSVEGSMEETLQRLGLELGPPAGFSMTFGVLHETSKSRWFVMPDPAEPTRFLLLYHPSVIDNPHWQEFKDYIPPPRDRLAGKQASQWRKFYLAAAAAGVEQARTALKEFDEARTARWDRAQRDFTERANGPWAERIRALAVCTEALALTLHGAESEREGVLQAYRDDVALLAGEFEAQARNTESMKPARARCFSLLGRAVSQNSAGEPLDPLDEAGLSLQQKRLAQFARSAELFERVQGHDWRGDFETLCAIHDWVFEFRYSEDPVELGLNKALPAAAAEIMEVQQARLAETAAGRGLHSTAAGHFYLAYNLGSLSAQFWTEPRAHSLQPARDEALKVLYEFFPRQRECADGPEGYEAAAPQTGILADFLSSTLCDESGIDLAVADEDLARNCRRSMCVWASRPELASLKDEYWTDRRTVEWEEMKTIPSIEYRDWQGEVDALEAELDGLVLQMGEALERASTVTGFVPEDFADKYVRHENGWEITVTTIPETGESMMLRYDAEREHDRLEEIHFNKRTRLEALLRNEPPRGAVPVYVPRSEVFEMVTQQWSLNYRLPVIVEIEGQREQYYEWPSLTYHGRRHAACPHLGLEARDEWISEEQFRALQAGAVIDPRPSIRYVIKDRIREQMGLHAAKLHRLDVDQESRELEGVWFGILFNWFTWSSNGVPEPGTVERYLLASIGRTL